MRKEYFNRLRISISMAIGFAAIVPPPAADRMDRQEFSSPEDR
jgi:hypothetical protein